MALFVSRTPTPEIVIMPASELLKYQRRKKGSRSDNETLEETLERSGTILLDQIRS